MKLMNYVMGNWKEGTSEGKALVDASNGKTLAFASTEGVDFKEVLNYARTVGNPALRNLTFHERARKLKALALHLMSVKDKFYEISYQTGATKVDSWIDIEGGIGNLFVMSSKGRREMPDTPFYVDGNAEKISKKLLKWFLFAIISFLIANAFLAYFIGGDILIQHILDGPFEHLKTFINLLIFTTVFYFVFAWFREQVCIIVCPYGRLQGVLLDNKSIIVAYDYERGEGRQKMRKKEVREEKGFGDCIDCNQCVLVCPTGIDIRNGTQLECVNCTACIDACDEIMDKVGFERGLIGYNSENNIEKGEKFSFNARIISYSIILTLLVGFLVTLVFIRNDVESKILRLPGQLYTTEGSTVRNVYTFKLLNKTTESYDNVSIKLISHAGKIQVIGGNITIPKGGLYEGTLFILIDKKDLHSSKEKLKIGIYSNDNLIETDKTNFLGPLKID